MGPNLSLNPDTYRRACARPVCAGYLRSLGRMRRLAIASLILPLIGLYALYMTRTRIPIAPRLGGPDFSEMAQLQVLLFVIAPAIVGLAFSLFVILAPIFGRVRVGIPYAVLGFCSSAGLLALALVVRAA